MNIVIDVTSLCLSFIFCHRVLKGLTVVLLDMPRQHKAGLTKKKKTPKFEFDSGIIFMDIVLW